jgi:hypothetical protein
VCCAAVVAAAGAGLPATAYAAENLPPGQPLVQDLTTGSEACVCGEERPYVSTPPTLGAVLYDPEEDNQPAEANPVGGEFEAGPPS